VNELASPPSRFLFRWAGVLARSDSPSVFELVEAGWLPVTHDTRYGSTLCMIEERRAQQIADEHEAAELIFGWGEEAP
jgi:hypothetical protein